MAFTFDIYRALDAAWCPEALNKAGYPWKVYSTALGKWVGDTMLRWENKEDQLKMPILA